MTSPPRAGIRSRPARLGLAGAAALALVGSVFAVSSGTANAAPGCSVTMDVNQWNVGFTANLTVTNVGDPITGGWTLEWDFAGNQHIDQSWSSRFTQSGQHATLTNETWNGDIPTNGVVLPGFNASYSGTNELPTEFTLNGTTCTGATTPPDEPPGDPGDGDDNPGPPSGEHVDNPFAGAVGYVNPDRADVINAFANQTGGDLGQRMAEVADIPTAIWLDRIAAITEGTGLRGNLDNALAQQQTSGDQVYAEFVIYDLPNRDCAALASNGELRIGENGLQRYETEYIDPIIDILSDPTYQDLRIVTYVEPDSLPNLVTNLSIPDCAEANSSGAYIDGVTYALNNLHAIPNVYTYVDIAHSAWLGWPTNRQPALNLFTNLAQGTDAGFASIDGFVSDTANYTPLEEPFMDANQNVNGQQLISGNFYEFNPTIDERGYDEAFYSGLLSHGWPASVGMVMDTGRNGWGGAARPAGPGSSTDLNTFINQSKIDRRVFRGDWCNQTGAGIGERPRANPLPTSSANFDAFVWVKPPGESDGTSDETQTEPDPEGKRFDPMCGPNNTNDHGTSTGALDGAPAAGDFFPAQFTMLVQNAFPAL